MKKESADFLNIKSWTVEDRPRQKLLLKGKAALSDSELIAILLGTGTASMNAVDVAKNVLQAVNNDLNELAGLSVKDLTKIKGIGEAKAISIVSALELGRRRKDHLEEERPKINSSKDIFDLLKGEPSLFWGLAIQPRGSGRLYWLRVFWIWAKSSALFLMK